MKDWHARCRTVCWVALLLTGTVCVRTQENQLRTHLGVPQDWSQRQVIFSREGLELNPQLLYSEPRILHQVMQRWGAGSGFFQGAAEQDFSSSEPDHRDWNVGLGGGRLAPLIFPAKFTYDPRQTPSCSNDYVVFPLLTSGVTGGQANFVAFNNLYSGTNPNGICGTGPPSVMFAYNTTTVTGGKNATSAVISLDGKKIAFAETVANQAIFHVLTWVSGQGGIQSAVVPGSNGSSMTSLTFSNTDGSTRSSPWVDYSSDTAYVGADDGRVYKIHPVFGGTPAVTGSYSLSTSPTFLLSPPVLDSSRHILMVGSGNGKLYQVNTSTGAITTITIGGGTVNQGILAPPIVDVTNGTTFVVVADDGSTGAFLVELDTTSLSVLAKAKIGIGSHNSSRTTVKLYQPAFDNNYFNNPSSGKVRLCGTGASDITPWQYAFGFSGRVMNTTAVFSKQIMNSTTARCTGWTEFFNPNINGGTDYFFFGLLLDCISGSSGCVVERLSDTQLVTFDLNSGPSGIVVDNYSTAAQASSIYMTNQHAQNLAIKLTQNGLK